MNALKYETTVADHGEINLPPIPLQEGTAVEVIILVRDVPDDELISASESSLEFWDNPTDDEVWNNA